MRNASALSRFVAMMIATGVVLGGCGQTSYSSAPDAGSSNAGSSEAGAVGTPLTGSGADRLYLRHGFVKISEDAIEGQYERPVTA